MLLLDILDASRTKLRDASNTMTDADIEAAIQEAVYAYSALRPYKRVKTYADGVSDNVLSVPLYWVENFSWIYEIEVNECEPPCYIDPSHYTVDIQDNMEVIRIYYETTEQLKVYYSSYHVLDEETTTIPSHHQDAIVNMTVSLLCDQLSNQFSSNVDSGISADSVDFTTKSEEYAKRAAAYKRMFENAVKPKVISGMVIAQTPEERRYWRRYRGER